MNNLLKCSDAVFETGRIRVLGSKTVASRYNSRRGGLADTSTDSVVRFQITHGPTASMNKQSHGKLFWGRSRRRVDSHYNAIPDIPFFSVHTGVRRWEGELGNQCGSELTPLLQYSRERCLQERPEAELILKLLIFVRIWITS